MRRGQGHLQTVGEGSAGNYRRQIHCRIVIGAPVMLHRAVGQYAEREDRRGAVEVSCRSDVFRLFLMFPRRLAGPFEQAIDGNRRQRRKPGAQYAGSEATHRSRSGLQRLCRNGSRRLPPSRQYLHAQLLHSLPASLTSCVKPGGPCAQRSRSVNGTRSGLFRVSAQVDRVAFQHLQWHDLQGRLVGRGQPDFGGLAGFECFLPALGA